MSDASPLDFETSYVGRSVLVTGHTGFTGGWLCSWLLSLGARVTGLALPPETIPNLFDLLGLADRLKSNLGNINDRQTVRRVFEEAEPDVVFHLAAQPLVSRGYDDPVGTFMTNVMGTAHLLEEARNCPATRAVVCITTDKVYENQEWLWAYRENDALGGKDPYSASKAAAELVAMAYQRTMNARGNGVALATARGGNIVGGGDWADNRIVPDFVRAVASGSPLTLRHAEATRPWQHVLALVHAYLLLGSSLLAGKAAEAWNFGPAADENQSVRTLVETMAATWRRPDIHYGTSSFAEAGLLQIDSTKARSRLGWIPPWRFADTVRQTAAWYAAWLEAPESARAVTEGQIAAYRAALGAT